MIMRARYTLKLVAQTVVFELTRYCKLSFVIGSKWAFFSGIGLFGPLIGLYNTIGGTLMVYGIRCIYVLGDSSTVHPLQLVSLYHIPTLCAALYWPCSRNSLLVRLLIASIPLVSIFLFVLHPVGWQAMLYTIWWLIPLVSLLVPHNYRWIHALSSTLIAHAVGSVIWIWTHDMSAATWIGLVPVVLYERCMIASVLWLVIEIVEYVQHFSVFVHAVPRYVPSLSLLRRPSIHSTSLKLVEHSG